MHPSIIQRIRSSVRKPRPEVEAAPQRKQFVIGIKGLIREKHTAEASRLVLDNTPDNKLDDLEERNRVIEAENRRLRNEIRLRKRLLIEKKELIKKLKEEIIRRKELALAVTRRTLARVEEEAQDEPNIIDYPESLSFLINNGTIGPMHNPVPVSYTHLTLPTNREV
eukprot:TRINITY_DN2291_c0_g2_i1.p1 TRINITY_DN2291_c0_g2~~TRINITY_DN2291_c0_g2_i1.p1  ORF type:complete len:167 (+),score=48.24 TRINITY_DN2291_c0_g2_i1:64-564(+)